MDLKRLVEQSDTPAGRWFDNTVFALIVVSLVTFSIETLPNLSPDIAAILIFLSAVGIYYFKHDSQPELFASVFHSLWWAFVTLTTVGYGDVYPITLGGRIFTVFVLFVGLGLVAAPTGLLASALAQARKEEEEEG